MATKSELQKRLILAEHQIGELLKILNEIKALQFPNQKTYRLASDAVDKYGQTNNAKEE